MSLCGLLRLRPAEPSVTSVGLRRLQMSSRWFAAVSSCGDYGPAATQQGTPSHSRIQDPPPKTTPSCSRIRSFDTEQDGPKPMGLAPRSTCSNVAASTRVYRLGLGRPGSRGTERRPPGSCLCKRQIRSLGRNITAALEVGPQGRVSMRLRFTQ